MLSAVIFNNYLFSRRFFFAAFLILNSQLSIIHSQQRETRAVWLATNHRLDWPPPTFNSEKQKQALAEIFDNLKSKNFNTVYFQARSNGAVLFNSSFESFSYYITGEADGDSDYDPLKYAIEQAHKHGMEIHAWVNVFMVFNGIERTILKSKNHLVNKKSEWIAEDNREGYKSLWLDPGLPEARNYIIDLICEMVENYDVDGVHLDYIRYPGKNFDDDFSYKIHGGNLTRDEFRRQNITATVEEIYKQVKAIKPYVKVGAAPIGVYKNYNGLNAWESYYDLYQDSYGWMKKGIVDYLTPQTYWGLSGSPRFDLLAKDWRANSYGKNIVLGVAAFKEDIKNEIAELVKVSRDINAAGVSFFRYQHIKDLDFPFFKHKSFPALSQIEKESVPFPPQKIKLISNSKNNFTINWQVQSAENPLDSICYYSIYNLPNDKTPTFKEFLFDVVSAPRSSVTLAIDKPTKVNYYFAIKSVNKTWTESGSSDVVKVEIEQMKELSEKNQEVLKPVLIKDENSFFVSFENPEKQQIEIAGEKEKKNYLLKNIAAEAGYNILNIEKEISGYELIKINFVKTKKEVVLKL